LMSPSSTKNNLEKKPSKKSSSKANLLRYATKKFSKPKNSSSIT
jgi:hypothetical protein